MYSNRNKNWQSWRLVKQKSNLIMRKTNATLYLLDQRLKHPFYSKILTVFSS